MEFENNEESPDARALRDLAQSKNIVIQPLSQDITPDEIPEEQVAAQHEFEPALANTPNDTEATFSSDSAATGHQTLLAQSSRLSLALSVSIGIVLFVSLLLVAITRLA